MHWLYVAGVVAFVITIYWVALLASKNGSKAAQLEALKAELKKQAEEQARAQRITDKVSYMSADDARRKLCELQSKQR